MFSRGRFICGGASMAAMLPSMLRPIAAAAANNTILVAVLLAGGNDGLNTVVPLAQYGTYNQLRKPTGTLADPTQSVAIPLANLAATAFDPNPSTPATSASQYAFHPNMTALRQVYGGGHMAVVLGVGIPPDDPNRLSHEVGQFDWQAATIKQLGRSQTGWLGQTFDAYPLGGPAPMISLIGQAPILMNGNVQRPLVLGVPLESFTIDYASSASADVATRQAAFVGNIATARADRETEAIRALASSANTAVSNIQALAAANTLPDYPKQTTFIGSQLQQIARLIVGGVGARAFYAIQGGYDTHSAQQQAQPLLLQQLSDALATFYAYIKGKNASSNVVIMTFSDFGRRAISNSALGTDHGTANNYFVIGDQVKGGVYGAMPPLNALDSSGNLKVQVDFRNQISDIVRAMGADPVPIVGGSYSPLGFL